MANEPTFDPNAFRDSGDNDRRNRAVQDIYEPGSTFKVVTASAAIEEKLMPVDALIDTNPGVIRLPGNRVVDEYHGHNYGVLSFTDVIVKSSNIGAIKIGFKVGRELMSEYVRRFRFGHPVSRDFPGESPGIVWGVDKLTEGALASMSMGYQVSVTPLQMLAAVAAVANGGEFVEPRVVRAEYRHGLRIVVRPTVLQRAISADTAATLTGIMEGVVERGTAKLAQIPGFTIAGKTGTASKLIGGQYSNTENYASFVGFLPSRQPAVAIIVVIDSPHGNGNSGGVVSAPIFKRIAESTVRYLGIAPTVNPNPPVLIARAGEGPRSPAALGASAPAINFVVDAPPGTVPDLRGMSAREATQTLTRLGLSPYMAGDGVVVSQNPAPGTPFEAGSVCQLVLARGPAGPVASTARP
jgi:cell division protein FtsI/penicillin-binding protein 2